MKKSISILLVTVLCLCALTSCSSGRGVRVNDVKVNEGVCLYLREEAKKENKEASEEELEQKMAEKLAEYVAINTEFASRKLSLTPLQKHNLSQSVNALWSVFGEYYTSIGVTKQDITKVETEKAAKDAVMVAYYAENGGTEPLAETELKSFFESNYIAFRSITGYFTTVDDNGSAVPLSEEERAQLVQSFQNEAASMNGGVPLEDAARKLPNTTVDTDTVVHYKGTNETDQSFFQHVLEIENDQAGVFTVGDYIFLVAREDINANDGSLFFQYRTDCLKTLRGEAFQKVVDGWASQYTVSK